MQTQMIGGADRTPMPPMDQLRPCLRKAVAELQARMAVDDAWNAELIAALDAQAAGTC